MSSKRKGGACNLTSSSEEDEGSTENVKKESGRKRPVWQTFRIYSSGFVTESNREERKKVATKIPLDGTTSEGKIRDILIKELPQLRDKSFKFFTKDKAGKRYFCPCSLQCEGGDHDSEEWNGRNIPRAAKSNRTVYILIESTTVEETGSGGVQNDSPTNPVSSDPQFRGSVGQYSSNPLNQKEVRVVVKDHDSVSCPDLSLSGLEHQENISVPPLSVKHGNDLNQWPTQLTQLSQEQTVPKTEYKKVKDGGRVTEENEREGEEQKDEGDEEMQTDMWNDDVAPTSENVFPQRRFESGYDTFSSENNALLLVDTANSVEDEKLQTFRVNDSPPLDPNLNGTSLLSAPTEFMELYQEYTNWRTPLVIDEIVPEKGDVAGGKTFFLSLKDACTCAVHHFQAQFGPLTIPVERRGDKEFKGKVPPSSSSGVVQVYLLNSLGEKMSNTVSFEYITPSKAKEDFVENDINDIDDLQEMLRLLSIKTSKMKLNSKETKGTKETNQPGGGKTQALSLLYMIVDTAAKLNDLDFFRIVFSTHVCHSVFKSFKDKQMSLEETARRNGHEELAYLLEEKHWMYQDDENESDDEVDWKELARAIEKYRTLKGETAEKKSIPSTSSSERIHGYLGDGESSTSLSSLHLLDVESCPENTFEEQQTTPESNCGEESDTSQTTVAEGCPESTFEEQQTTPKSRCGEEPDTCQATVSEGCPENTREEQQTTPESRRGEEPDTCQTTGWVAKGLIQDGMSETNIINTIWSSDKLLMDKAHKVKDSQSSVGEKSLLANLYSNPLHLGGGDPIIGKTYQMHVFSPKEVSRLRRKLQPFDAGETIASAFYPDRDQAIYNLMERLDTPPELDFLKEPKQALTGGLKAQKRKGATAVKFAKTESIPSLYSPLPCVEVESGVEIATLAGSVSTISLNEVSSEKELSQDARSFAEQFFVDRFFEASQNERKSVCLSLVRTRRFAFAFLITLLVIVGTCAATVVTLQGSTNKATSTTAVETRTTTRQACSNGLLTLPCEGVTDVNAIHKVQWKIKFPDIGWNEFAYCNKSGMNCIVTRPVLPEGIKVLKVSNRTVSLQRIAKNNTDGYAQTLCQVLYSDNSLTSHVYKINFTAKCVWIQERRDLNLTTFLLSILQCERVAHIGWYSINESAFAYCHSCQDCRKISFSNVEPAFQNRLQVTRGSLLLTAIQENDDGRTIRIKVYMKKSEESTVRDFEADIVSVHTYTLWIFVNTSRPPVFNNTKNAEWQMTTLEKATIHCPILQEVVKEDGTFRIVYWSLCTSKRCDDQHSTWDWIAGMNQEGTTKAVRSGINITSGGALEIQKVQLSDAGLYKCTVKRSDDSSLRIWFATLVVNGVGVRADSKRIECLNEQIALDCPDLESVIQNGTFLELLWRVTDPEDLKKQNIVYCNNNLECTRYGNIGRFEQRIIISDPVRGTLLVKQMVLNDRLSYTCVIERGRNKAPIAHKIVITSSKHCLSSTAGQNLNLSQPFQGMFSKETVEDIEWYSISQDGTKVKIAYCSPSWTCILLKNCTSSCPEYLTRLKTDGLSIILSNVKKADRGLEFQCQIHPKTMNEGPRVYMIRIKAISPREGSTKEPNSTCNTSVETNGTVTQDSQTVGGSLSPEKTQTVEKPWLWSGLAVSVAVAATALIVIKHKRTRRKKNLLANVIHFISLMPRLGADLPIKDLTIDEIRFIAQRLDGKGNHGLYYWQIIGEKLGLGAECREWESAENPTEKLLKAYGEKEGSTIRNFIKALRDPEVGLTHFATEIMGKFFHDQDYSEAERI